MTISHYFVFTYFKVDIMAICSERGKLRNIVLTAAGTAIYEEYHKESTGVQKTWLETPPGLLKCQKVVYCSKGVDALNFFLTIFVKTWMTCAYENNYQSIGKCFYLISQKCCTL